MHKSILISAVVVILLAGALIAARMQSLPRQIISLTESDYAETATHAYTPSPSAKPAASPTPTLAPLPKAIALSVPFLVQAPHANWDALHEDACEEASLIMVKHYLEGTSIDLDAGDQEIQNLIQTETAADYGASVTAEELATIATMVGLKGTVAPLATADDLKRQLAAGRPVILPLAGQQLSQPHFTPPGPVYHMLVVTGYDADGFITNDPGVSQGKGYRYSFQNLIDSAHDWDAQDINAGAKVYLTVSR